MNLSDMRAIVKEELEHIPPGRDPQNMLRAFYWMTRMNSLSKKPTGPTDRLGVLRACIDEFKKLNPNRADFEFQYDRPFFRGA
jgi:hypothetical protein